MEIFMRFSFVIPAYNEELFIEKCLKSIFNQTYGNYEVIVVDDGSTDKTSQLVAKYNVVLIHQKHKGVAAALNKGIEHAKGDVVCLLGADDFVASDYLEKNLKPFLEPNVIGVFPVMEFVTPSSLIGKIFYYYRQIFLVKSKHSHWPMLWRRQVFNDARFDEALVVGEDADFWKQVKDHVHSTNWVFKYGTGVYYAAGQPDTLVTNFKSSFWYGLGFVKNCKRDLSNMFKIISIVFFSCIPFVAVIFLLTLNVFCLFWIILFCGSFFFAIFKAISKHNLKWYVFFIPLLLIWRALGHLMGIFCSFFLYRAKNEET
jgi:glycosyltransferase involved in cell wall biosynthesis